MLGPTRPAAPADLVAHLPFSRYHQGFLSPGAFHVFRYEDSGDPRDVRTRPHRHDFIQLLWLEEGRGKLLCDLEEYAFEGRSLAFFSPGRLHAWDHQIEPRGIMLGFPVSFFQADADHPGVLRRLSFLHEPVKPVIPCDEKAAVEMARLFSQVLREASCNQPGRDDIVRALVTIILTKIRRQLEKAARSANQPAGPASLLAHRFRLALDRHFPLMLKVSDYARLLGVSRSYLNAELRAHTGSTASEHIHARMLLEAKRLLVHSPRTIADISHELQFRDPSYFSRFFRLHTRVSPGSYRKQQHERLVLS